MSDEFATWMAEATPDETTVWVCLNRRLYREFYDADRDLETTRFNGRDSGGGTTLDDVPPTEELHAKAQRVVELEQAVRDAQRPLVFVCLPYHDWKALAKKHPVTEEQRQQNPRAEINEDTFWPAAVAACCTRPGLTVAQAEWLRGFLPREKWMEIVEGVRKVNVGGSGIPKSVSSTVASLRHGLSSTTAALEGSRSASSGDASESSASPTG